MSKSLHISEKYISSLLSYINRNESKKMAQQEIRKKISHLYKMLTTNPNMEVASMDGINVKKCESGYEIWYDANGKKRFLTRSFT